MKKRFLILGIFFVVLVGAFLSPRTIYAQACTPEQRAAGWRQENTSIGGVPIPVACFPPSTPTSTSAMADAPGEVAKQALQIAGDGLLKPLFLPIGQFLLTISSVILITTGWIFDGIVNITIVNVADYLGQGSQMGQAISNAWGTLRDVANMFFIFVLIFAAIRSMFDLNFGNASTTIRNIILVALLINFSLFFSKVVVDASNVVALGFYKSISQANSATFQNATSVGGTANFEGISGGYMRMLGLQTFYGASILNGAITVQSVITIAVMGSLFMLVASIIFLISGIMFVARFIILIFLMVLSPLAFISITIPGGSKIFDQWKSALIDQSFFAPVFFALTWVSFRIGSALITRSPNPDATFVDIFTSNPAKEEGVVVILLNYVLVIGFSIAALVFAKQMATKTAGFTQISGAIGSGAVGGAAFVGRQSIGRAANMISENKREAWSKTSYGRAGLWLADKGKSASYDARNIADTGLGKAVNAGKVTDILGKAGGSGGFKKSIDDKAKSKAEYAKRVYGQTEAEKEKIKEEKDKEEKVISIERVRNYTNSKEEAEKASSDRKEYLRNKLKPNKDNYNDLISQKNKLEQSLKNETDQNEIEYQKKELEAITARIDNERKLMEEIEKDLDENDNVYKNLKSVEEKATSRLKEAKEKFESNRFDDSEYSEATQDLINAAKKRQSEFADRLKKSTPISSTLGTMSGTGTGAALGAIFGPAGVFIGGLIGAGIGAWTGGKVGAKIPYVSAGNLAASRSVRAVAEGKESKDKKRLAKDVAEVLGVIENNENKTQEPKTN